MRIWNRIGCLIFALAILLALACTAFAAPAVVVSQQPVFFDGVQQPISAYNIDNYNYFKLRDLAQMLSGSAARFSIGADVDTLTISIVTGEEYVSRGDELTPLPEDFESVVASSWRLTVNGIERPVSAYNIDGSNYYKLADLGSVIGFGVNYDAATNSVLVTSAHTFRAEVPACAPIDPSWFDDAAIVGDSVSYYLRFYLGEKGLGNATILQAGSLSSTNALWDVSDASVHPSYLGQKMKVEDAIVLCGAKKVYIMLGSNDIGLGLDKAVNTYVTFLESILRQAPDVQIYIQSVTPMTNGSTRADSILNNTSISQYNARMKEICQERGWYFLDVASVVTGPDGYLIQSYCSDHPTMGMHLTPDAVGLWVDYLRTHVPAV